jgi:hypothetical protein
MLFFKYFFIFCFFISGPVRATILPTTPETTTTTLGCAGIFRKINQGNWLQVYSSSQFLNGSYDRAQMIWPNKTNRVYVLDRKTGLLASSNAGASFNLIFPLSYTTSPSRTGHLALDPTQGTSRLYVSAGKELRRLQISYNPAVYTTKNGYNVSSTILPLPNGASAGPIVWWPIMVHSMLPPQRILPPESPHYLNPLIRVQPLKISLMKLTAPKRFSRTIWPLTHEAEKSFRHGAWASYDSIKINDSD